jgi:hypothetical protein
VQDRQDMELSKSDMMAMSVRQASIIGCILEVAKAIEMLRSLLTYSGICMLISSDIVT